MPVWQRVALLEGDQLTNRGHGHRDRPPVLIEELAELLDVRERQERQ